MSERKGLNRFRWWLFRKLSAVGWAICPEPDRTILQAYSVSWDRLDANRRAIGRALSGDA